MKFIFSCCFAMAAATGVSGCSDTLNDWFTFREEQKERISPVKPEDFLYPPTNPRVQLIPSKGKK